MRACPQHRRGRSQPLPSKNVTDGWAAYIRSNLKNGKRTRKTWGPCAARPPPEAQAGGTPRVTPPLAASVLLSWPASPSGSWLHACISTRHCHSAVGCDAPSPVLRGTGCASARASDVASFTRCPSCVLSVLAFLRSRVRCKPRLPPQRPACARGTPHRCRRPWHTPRRRPAWPTCPPLLIAMATSLRVRLGSFPRPPARASLGGEGARARPAAASALLRAPALARGLWPVARPPPPPAEVLLRDCFSAGNAPGESCSPGSPCWGSAPAPGRVQKPRGADGSAGSFPAWGSMWVSAGLSLGRPRCRPGALTAPLAPQLPAARALPHSRPKAQGLLAAGQEPSSTARAEGLQPGVQKPNKNNPAGKILET